MKRCKYCGSANLKYCYARIAQRKHHQVVRAVYYCFGCLKENEIIQKIEMLPGFGEEQREWEN